MRAICSIIGGRLTTYSFLGVLAGALGQMICTPQGLTMAPLNNPLELGQRILAIVAGTAHDRDGAAVLRPRPQPEDRHCDGLRRPGPFADPCAACLDARRPGGADRLGVFNGFLPCPLVYAFVAQAASTAAATPGFLPMLAFGLGTFPAMLMMGGIGRLLAPAWRQRGVWLAGSCILLLGLVTLARGILPLGPHIAHSLPLAPPA